MQRRVVSGRARRVAIWRWLIMMLGTLIAARGIRKDDHVVLYDTVGIFSAPRGWFTFKVCLPFPFLLRAADPASHVQAMGHEKVSVLDGGMPRYLAELLGEGAERGPPEATVEVGDGCPWALRGADDHCDEQKSEYPVPKTKDAVRCE